MTLSRSVVNLYCKNDNKILYEIHSNDCNDITYVSVYIGSLIIDPPKNESIFDRIVHLTQWLKEDNYNKKVRNAFEKYNRSSVEHELEVMIKDQINLYDYDDLLFKTHKYTYINRYDNGLEGINFINTVCELCGMYQLEFIPWYRKTNKHRGKRLKTIDNYVCCWKCRLEMFKNIYASLVNRLGKSISPSYICDFLIDKTEEGFYVF